MPTYEYQCKACAHEFERDQRISDPPVKTCPRCKARQVKRLISRTSFHLKGGGWYSDLYSKPAKGSAKKDADSKADSGTKPDSGVKPDSPSKPGSGKSDSGKSDTGAKSDAKPASDSPAKSDSGSGKGSGGSGGGSKAAA